MRALVITGGESPPHEYIQLLSKNARLIIAADSGLEACADAHIEPDLVVGDFDSVHHELLSTVTKKKIITYPEDKDYTDTELAIAIARERGADRIVLAGGGAGRLDHLLALRALFNRTPPIDEWYTAHECVVYLAGHAIADITIEENSLISVFPVADGASGMHSEGLKWPLEGLVWSRGEYGVSNRSIGRHVKISSGEEALLLVLPLGTQVALKTSP